MKLIHIPVAITTEPGKPTTYRALCGHESADKKEYRKDKQPLAVVTCGTCIAKMGRVVVSESWREIEINIEPIELQQINHSTGEVKTMRGEIRRRHV